MEEEPWPLPGKAFRIRITYKECKGLLVERQGEVRANETRLDTNQHYAMSFFSTGPL